MSLTITHPHLELIQACKLNDRKAQQKLYQLYAQPMFSVCYRIVNQQEEAEDVLQEAFIRMFRQVESFREEASFGAWFKRIVVNGSLNHIKQRKRQQDKIEHLKDESEESIAEEDEPNLPTYSVNQVQGALELLPEGYRVVFSLYLFEEYSHREIAEELGITESTSKSQLNRAKKKMRELLIQMPYEMSHNNS
ncbi:MAG: RNA polymerase sigma factor [Flavobacteriales bacterium]|nr:RNA polymerase sigma factor [Flavobacteriales bacterium]